jgi:hypothetical protein
VKDDINHEPKYDVAISFLDEQHALALRIKDELADRLTTFVYSKEQPELVGRYKDGVEVGGEDFDHNAPSDRGVVGDEDLGDATAAKLAAEAIAGA